MGCYLFLWVAVLDRLRRWWAVPAASTAHTTYEVTCGCGQPARGPRLPQHQTVRCARCGTALFVLPLSPYPPVPSADGTAAGVGARWPPWLLPAAGALVTGAALVLVYFLFFTSPNPSKPQNGTAPPAPLDVAERLEAVRRQMSQGHFLLANEELKSLEDAARGRPDAWSKAQLQEQRQLARQAALMADLLGEPFEDVLRYAAALQEREWQAEFRHRYRGKAVVFDLDVRAPEPGRYEHDWRLRARDKRAHLDLSDLELLRGLPAERPPRLLFGARLAGVRTEPGRGWVVRLEPDSGVLITDPAVAAACFASADRTEAEMNELLRRQAGWANLLPASGGR